MSGDFKTILSKDPCIADITPDLVYAVKSGASSTTYQSFLATSSSNSNQVFNVQIPSENIIVGRDALIQCPLQFTLEVTGVPVGDVAISWGTTASLQAFPLSSIMTTATATINNSTTSVNLDRVLPQILRLNSNRDLFRFNGLCPSLPDQNWGSYADAYATNSSPMASYANQSYDNDQMPRGAHSCFTSLARYNAGGVYQNASPVSTALTDVFRLSVFTITTEPIFVSPFSYANPELAMGMLGINNFSLNFNINASLNRLASVYLADAGSSVTIRAGVYADPTGLARWGASADLFRLSYAPPQFPSVQGPSVLLKLLSSQPSDKLQTRNVLPFFDLPSYLTTASAGANLQPYASVTLQSQAIQLSQLPDYFIIVARRPVANLEVTDPSSFLTIRSISMNLNNQSGLLSSATPQDLYRLSVKNGSQQTWSEFSGFALKSDNDSGTGELVPTIGSMLVISPNDLSLPDYLTAGSLGAFSAQFNLNVVNQYNEVINDVEICTIACNSGIFVLQQGTANIYTGILTREAVLKAKDEVPVVEHDRMIGGMKYMPRHPRHLGRMMPPAKMVGGVSSGGVQSAGGRGRMAGMY